MKTDDDEEERMEWEENEQNSEMEDEDEDQNDEDEDEEEEDENWPPAGYDAQTLRLRFEKANSIFIQKAKLAGIKVAGNSASSPVRRSDAVSAAVRAAAPDYVPGEWQFGFDFAKRRCGVCHYTTRQISLSLYYLWSASMKQVTDTVLHELA